MAFSDNNRSPQFIRLADLRPTEILVVACVCRWSITPRNVPPNTPLCEIKFRCHQCQDTNNGVYVFNRERYWNGDHTSPIIIIRPHSPKPFRQKWCP